MSADEPTLQMVTTPTVELSQVIDSILVKPNRMFGLVEASAWSDLCDSIVI